MITKKKAGRPVGTTGKARAITDAELKIVLAVAETTRNSKRNVALIVISHYLGLRAKEMAALKISDVFDGKELCKTLRLIAIYTKGNVHRDISLENRKVIAALEDYIIYRQGCDHLGIKLDAPLFRSEQWVHFSPNAMSRLFIDLYASAGIYHASSHTGRRSLITKLSESGVDLYSISKIAGHSNISTTAEYISDNPARLRNILVNV